MATESRKKNLLKDRWNGHAGVWRGAGGLVRETSTFETVRTKKQSLGVHRRGAARLGQRRLFGPTHPLV